MVLKSTDQKGVTMTKDHRRPDAQMAQGGLLEDPGFLKEIVERVLQELLEAEMTEHGSSPGVSVISSKPVSFSTAP